MKNIIFILLLFAFNANGQECPKFEDVHESVFQITETQQLIKVSHIYMNVAITQNEIAIVVLVEGGQPYPLLHLRDVTWNMGINCLEYENAQHRIYYCKDDKLVVENKLLNSKMSFFDGIPTTLEIPK